MGQDETQRARKLKKVHTKKLVKSNKSISRKKFFCSKLVFAISKMAQKSIFELGKKCNFTKKNSI